MTVTYSKLRTEKGFKAGSFEVTETGTLTVTTLNATTAIQINGNSIFPSSTQLSSQITQSGLTSLGTLTSLTVNGAVNLSGGAISLTSSTVGNINNMNIGATTRGTGAFTTLTANSTVTLSPSGNVTVSPSGNVTLSPTGDVTVSPSGNLIINPVTVGSVNNVNIGATTAGTGRFTSVTLTQEATNDSHVPTKQYVDRILTAFTIAFGT